MTNNILSALDALNVADLDRADWIVVGMALKYEGYPCDVWDNWSKNDTRYHAGECARIWNGFHGAAKPVTGASIIQIAKDRGWKPVEFEDGGIMDWDSTIKYDGIELPEDNWDPVKDLKTYIETLFDREDYVGYVTATDTGMNKDGKWTPDGRGVYWRTAGEILDDLDRHPNHIEDVIGDWKPEAGAWIRINPLDGGGVANNNVTDYKYALIESDTMSIDEQGAIYNQLELPIAALVYTGGKSLHAIVRIDAENKAEYRKRVDELYKILAENGFETDKQNCNPSRLSRMPGVTRNGKKQYLVATNMGRASWLDWQDFLSDAFDDLPDIVTLSDYIDNLPNLPGEMIQGILRRGHKMLISGPSKAGKSFLLIELSIAIAEGVDWLGFKCSKGRVLYINLEIDPSSAVRRFFEIYDARHLPYTNMKDIEIWNLRGNALPLDQLSDKLIRKIKNKHFDVIIFDPIYKIITGDENNATDMGAFCNQFDKICAATGCSAIYCHHHSKGPQGQKKAMDRASGSGVFARDPDAQIDLIELEMTEDVLNHARDDRSTAWQIDATLREFSPIKPVNIWFDYPLHVVDKNDSLKTCKPAGANQKTDAETTRMKHYRILDLAFEESAMGEETTSVKEMSQISGVSEKSIRNYLKEFPDKFSNEKGTVKKL